MAGVLLSGCGGGGKTGSGASIGLNASKPSVAYGETVHVSWSTGTGANILTGQCNFPVSGANGSITDTPSYDTTYRIKGYDADGNSVTRTKTVKVAKSLKTILLVGDTATSGTNQIQQYLQSITVAPVAISLTIPSNLSNVDAMVLLPSGNITPSDNAKVISYLGSGGAVILVQQVPKKFINGNLGVGDVSAIGSWCAGVTTLASNSASERVLASSPSGIPLSAVLFGDAIDGYDLRPVASTAITLTSSSASRSSAFVYKPTAGGKVGFIGDIGIGTSEAQTTARELLLTEVRWALDGS